MNLLEGSSDSLKLILGGWLVPIGGDCSSAGPEVVLADIFSLLNMIYLLHIGGSWSGIGSTHHPHGEHLEGHCCGSSEFFVRLRFCIEPLCQYNSSLFSTLMVYLLCV